MSFRAERAVVLVLAFARFLFCLYRAVEQSFTVDEAFTYNHFLSGPWQNIYGNYDANNHVLFSILAKLAVHCFGLSELSLRLPSLIAGFFLTLGIFEVLRLAVYSLWVRWLAFLALSLHPLLLDFSIAARGYGLALAFLVWALFYAMRRRFFPSGVFIGLALSANLTMALPAAGLIGAVLLLDAAPMKERFRNLAVMVAPAEAIFVAICFGALRSAQPLDFYVGSATLGESVMEMIRTSFHAASHGGLIGDRARHFFEFPLLPLVLAFIATAGALAFFKDRKLRPRLVPIATFAIASLAMIATHVSLGVPYPIDRTGLSFILLFGICWAVAADLAPRFRRVNLALAGILTLHFVTQLHAGYFSLWPDQARIKDAVAVLRNVTANRAPGSVRISTSWYDQSVVEFYRLRWNITPWAPVLRNESTQFSGHDFYIFGNEDPQAIRKAGIRILFRDPETNLSVGMNWPAQMRP